MRRLSILLFILSLSFCAVATAVGTKDTNHKNWFPIIYYTNETSLAAGAGFMKGFDKAEKDGRKQRPNSFSAWAIVTLRKQIILKAIPDLYFHGDQTNLRIDTSLSRVPATFFGYGENTKRVGEDYDNQYVFAETVLVRRLWRHLRAGLRHDFLVSKITPSEEAELLTTNTIVGANGGRSSGLGLVVDWDNRNHTFWPTQGGIYRVSLNNYDTSIASDYEFSQAVIDLKHYFSPIPNHAIAWRLFSVLSKNTPPFYRMAMLGGPKLNRGIYEGQFRDQHGLVSQLEYRLPLKARWGADFFAAIGEVSSQTKQLISSNMKWSVGAGLRYAVDPKHKMNLRVDLGFSAYGIAPIIYIDEAF